MDSRISNHMAENEIRISVIDHSRTTFNECDEQAGSNVGGVAITVGVEVGRKVNKNIEVTLNRSPNPNILNTSVSSEKSTPPTEEKPKPISRRSSVFKRRLTFGECFDPHVSQQLDGSCEPSQTRSENGMEFQTDDERIPLQEYIKKLKFESDEWSSVRRQRKRKYKEILKMPPEKLSMENAKNLLSEEDQAFLEDAPDYEKIARDLKTLVDDSMIGTRIIQKAKIQTLELMSQIEKKLDNITTDIINRSCV